jgi:transcriptional regulator with XRE-family HTH domain
MTVQELFIANLKSYRKIKKISQLKLAELCDSSQTYIAEIEVGKKFPSIEMIEKIASAFDIESYLLFQNDTNGKIGSLTVIQKMEIADKIQSAIVKIINSY